MEHIDLRNKLFDTLLETAVQDNFQQELDEFPPEEVLKKEYAPSPELNLKIKRMIANNDHKLKILNLRKIAKRAAIIVAIILPLITASLLSVEASRNVIFNAVMEWKSDHADIYFQQDSSNQASQDTDENSLYQPQYLPDGFIESSTVKISATYEIRYQNKENASIIFDQTTLSGEGTTAVDTEHTTHKEITLNGQKASLFAAKSPNGKNYILWQIGKTNFKLSSSINQSELIKMAENIKNEKK